MTSGHHLRLPATPWSPKETSEILRNLLWREFELSRICAGWIPALSSFNDKVQIGQFSYWHVQNVKTLEQRIRELPGSFPEHEVGPALLRETYTRISLAPSEPAFWGAYQLLLEALYADYDKVLCLLDPVVNSPTMDTLYHVLVQRQRIKTWLRSRMVASVTFSAAKWLAYCKDILEAAGADNALEPIWPAVPEDEPIGPVPERGKADPEMRISETLLDAHKEAPVDFYMDPRNSPLVNNVRQMIYINATELAAAERVAYLYYAVSGMPLAFYYDTARHVWDELRHSHMGVRRLREMGYKIEDFRFWGAPSVPRSTTNLEHYEFYSELTNSAETCSFSYKRACAEAFRKHGDIQSAVQSEFDVADERLHTGFGTRWSPELFKTATGEQMTAAALVDRYRTAKLRQSGMSEEEILKAKKTIHGFCGSTGKLGEHMDAVANAEY